jgi:flagellar motor switch protein FliG
MTTPNDPRRIAAYAKTMAKKVEKPEPAARPAAEPAARSAVPEAQLHGKKAGGAESLPERRTGSKVPGGAAAVSGSSGLIKTSGRESNYRKVAKFLVLVGVDEAARILAKLDPEQVEKVSRELASIRRIDEVEAEALIAEFRALLSSGAGFRAGSLSGGVETARAVLKTAFGAEKGEALLVKAVPEAAENPFSFMEDFQGDQVAILLKDESSATVALVLSRVSPKLAAAALKTMEADKRLDTLKRIARIGKVDGDVVERVAAALREKARSVGRSEGETVDGRSALAEILKRTDASLGERLLDELEEKDPELGRELKDRLYTLDDVIKAEDRAVQERLRTMENRDIALLIKGRRPGFVEKILSNLSTTRRALVEEERILLGPVPKKDVDAVAKDFLGWFRAGREMGRILLIDDEDIVI